MIINQYQDVITTKSGRVFLVDYLVGDIRELTEDEYIESFDNETAELAKEYEVELEKICSTQMTVVLIPTYGCNLKCEYCYEGCITNTNDYSKLNVETVIEAILKIKEGFKYESVSFVMLGGEPISGKNLKWFESFFSDFRKTGVSYEVNCISNGVNVINSINSILNIGVTNIQITLDGMEEQQNKRRPSKDSSINVFKSVVRGIDTLLKNNINVNVRINVDTDNISDLTKLHHFFEMKKWWNNEHFSAYIYPISFNGNDVNALYPSEDEMLKLVTEELLNLENCCFSLDFHGLDFADQMLQGNIFYPNLTFCEAATNQFVFNDTGNIFTCWWGTSIEEFKLSDSKSIFSKEFNTNIAKWHNRKINKIEECIKCKYRFVCGGGCSYKAHLNHGSFQKGNCAPFKENINIFLDYLIDAELI
ncbi:MAG: radical SAM protein [Clostridia bacterium]|nr:radical SAM protein [Clostridia bacterium]